MNTLELKEISVNKKRKYCVKFTVTLSDTNAMGGVVYFANFVKWQGMVRELIMRHKCDFKQVMSRSLQMITHSCSVKFSGHLYFGDVVRIEVQTKQVLPTSFVMLFQYFNDETDGLVATGEQKVTFADSKTGQLCRVPEEIYQLAEEVELKNNRK